MFWHISHISTDIRQGSYFSLSRWPELTPFQVTSVLSRAFAYRSNGMELSSDAALLQDVQNLYHELEVWTSPEGLPERIQAGNCIYKNTAQVCFNTCPSLGAACSDLA